MIVAVSANGVIGVDNRLPWHYPADLARFKRLTTGATVVMGRLTYESMGRPLPRRRNLVVTRSTIPGVECFPDLAGALAAAGDGPVWLIGGAGIFAEGMAHADFIDVTWVPDRVGAPEAVRMPAIDPARFEAGPREPLPEDPRLEHQVFTRRR